MGQQCQYGVGDGGEFGRRFGVQGGVEVEVEWSSAMNKEAYF